MRLQTLDGDAPVSLWTVKTELGHGSVDMMGICSKRGNDCPLWNTAR